MATTKASGVKTAWTYTDDLSNDYAIAAKSVYVGGGDAAKFGGAAASAGDPGMPNGLKPRRAQVVSSAKAVRWPIVYAVGAALWTTPGTTVTLFVNGVDVEMTSSGTLRSERRERKPIIPPS